ILGGYPGGYLFYTLDGTTPTTGSTLFTGPLALTNTATVSVLSVSSDFTQSSTNVPVTVVIVAAYNLQTSIAGDGTLSINPPNGPYASNTVVTLTATAAAHWGFEGWAGDASGTQNPLSLTMDGPHSVKAVFVPNAYPLTVSTPGGGAVTANGQTIGASTYYPTGSVVSLLATPSSGWSFLGWQGSASGTNNPLLVAMSQTNIIQGIFGTLVGTNASGGSIVLSAPNPVPYGTLLTVSAVPNPGNYFVEWTGTGNGSTTPQYRLTVNLAYPNPTFGAVFGALPSGKYSLSTVANGSGYATVIPQNPYYSSGATVTLYAYANPGNSFFGWTGNASGTASPLTVVMTTNKVIQANFGVGITVSVTPLNQTVMAGSNAVLTASALGQPPLAYQWFGGQGAIATATTTNYTIYNAQPTNAGNYWVVVSNSAGSVTSSVATVMVIGAPWITNQPAPVTVTVGHAANFVVGAEGWPALAYQWQLNGARVAGATNAALTFSNALPGDAGAYSVAITNVYGSVTSNPAMLTVLPLDIVMPSGRCNIRPI
ncbi:MAG: immunoglobulin domain-containing protein, partial [Verrucomicrobiota bacterium]